MGDQQHLAPPEGGFTATTGQPDLATALEHKPYHHAAGTFTYDATGTIMHPHDPEMPARGKLLRRVGTTCPKQPGVGWHAWLEGEALHGLPDMHLPPGTPPVKQPERGIARRLDFQRQDPTAHCMQGPAGNIVAVSRPDCLAIEQ